MNDGILAATPSHTDVQASRTSRVWKQDDMATFSLLSDAVWVYDLQQSRIWWANDEACRLWRAESLQSLHARDLSDGSEATRLRLAAYTAAFEAGQRVTEQWTLYPLGQPVTLTCTCSGLRIDDGRLAMLVVARPATAVSSEDLRGIEALRHARVKVSLYRWADGLCLMRNPPAMRAYPLADHRFRDRFAAHEEADGALAALAAHGAYNGVVRVRTAQGQRWHGVDARRTLDPVTGDAAIVVSERDLTDLVRAEEALRASEQRLSDMVEHLPAGAAYVDGEAIYLNGAAEAITGYARQEVATLDAWFQAAYPTNRLEIEQRYRAARKTGAAVSTDLQIIRKDGRSRWIHFDAYLTDRGEVWLFQDVTEHREAAEALRRERAMLRSLIESLPDIIFFKDRNGAYVTCNRAALDYAGIPAEHAVGRRDADLFDADTAERRRRTDLIAMETGSSRVEEWFTYPDGRRVLVETAKAACRDAAGTVLGVVGISRDITERRQAEEELRQERALLQGIINAIPDAIFFKDRNGILRKVNHAFAAWQAKPPDSLVDCDCHDIWPPALADEIQRHDALVYAEDRPRRNEEIIPLPDGRDLCVEMLKAPIRDAHGVLLGLVGIGRDVTERKRVEVALRRSEAEKGHLANHDALTGLPNRRLFFDRLEMALVRAHRSGRCVALLFIDLDGFKQVNDAHGHDCGDGVLQITATRISGCLRKTDTVARLGGDEFCAILEEVTSAQNAGRLADEIIAAVSAPIAVDERTVSIGASVGIALHPQDADDARALLVAADNAMYQAKQAGRGRHVFWSGGACTQSRAPAGGTARRVPAGSAH